MGDDVNVARIMSKNTLVVAAISSFASVAIALISTGALNSSPTSLELAPKLEKELRSQISRLIDEKKTISEQQGDDGTSFDAKNSRLSATNTGLLAELQLVRAELENVENKSSRTVAHLQAEKRGLEADWNTTKLDVQEASKMNAIINRQNQECYKELNYLKEDLTYLKAIKAELEKITNGRKKVNQ